MKSTRLILASLVLLNLGIIQAQTAEPIETDVCIYGATSGGIAAAIQAAHMGRQTVIAEFGRHLGGLSSGGLGATDIGNKAAIGGISREFYRRIGRHYGQAEAWQFEPHVAEDTFKALLNETSARVYFQQRLASVRMEGRRIVEIIMENGQVFRAKMFIDATYEGDLMAKAKVTYTVGREANAQYGETLNGICAQTPKHQFTVSVDPYVTPGDPKNGLLPFIQPGDGGKPGAADHRLQAYNYRLCFTTNAANRMSLTPPANYAPERYELLARYLEALVAAGRKPRLGEFWNPIWMPNQKTDINNNGGFSTDYIGMNYDYPEADYATRARIAQEHEDYTRGFVYFMATSLRVPANMRAEMRTWGPCKDEFQDQGGWPHQLYVREARRMVSGYVMTERHCRGQEKAPDAIGLAAYNMDSHNCQRIVKNGRVENEGDVQVPPMRPYPISYRAIVPKVNECENLFVPICLSSTHIAYGSIRMEPVFMILGQSAATAACLAIEDRVAAQQVDYAKLRARLLADHQILEWTQAASTLGQPRAVEAKSLAGIVVDDEAGVKTGEWINSTAVGSRYVGRGYLHDGNTNKGNVAIVYTPVLPQTGEYEIVLWFTPHSNRATNVPVTINRPGAEPKTLRVNQKENVSNGMVSLGRYQLPQGKGTSVVISNRDTDGYVVADAVQFVPVKP